MHAGKLSWTRFSAMRRRYEACREEEDVGARDSGKDEVNLYPALQAREFLFSSSSSLSTAEVFLNVFKWGILIFRRHRDEIMNVFSCLNLRFF